MITMRDVANKAQVSIKTVSRVVNNETGVSENLRQRVLYTINELQYVPNVSAQRLKSGRTQTLAMVLPRVTSPYATKLLSRVLAEARERSYSVMVLEDNPLKQSERKFIESVITKGQADGLLIAPPGGDSAELLDFIEKNQVPSVLITPRSIDTPLCSVEATDQAGAREATRYLISLGHRRIAHITCLEEERFSHERLKGYIQALQEASITIDEDLIRRGDNSIESGQFHALKLLQSNDAPTAFFAGNDEMAVGAMMTAFNLGLHVPEDVSILGFDDAPIAHQVFPALTTVAQPIEEIADFSVGKLIKAIESDEVEHTHMQFPTRLVLRQSCAVPSSYQTDK